MGDAVESYRASLADLTFNSKPLINMLTMLAEENEQMAAEIVQVIDDQIDKVEPNQKLPLLYLIDSMIKNLTSTLYPQLFVQNIVSIFCRVFEEVDEKTRTSMYKLRQTWGKVIPNNKLFALDVRVKTIDPAWPITAKKPDQGSIHVNPRFLAQNQPTSSGENSPTWSSSPLAESLTTDGLKVLKEKEDEIKKLKLELELAETRAKLEHEKRRLEQKQEEMAQLRALKERSGKESPGSTPPDLSVASTGQRQRDPRLVKDPRLANSLANRDPRRRNMPMTTVSSTPATLITPLPSSLPFPPADLLPERMHSHESKSIVQKPHHHAYPQVSTAYRGATPFSNTSVRPNVPPANPVQLASQPSAFPKIVPPVLDVVRGNLMSSFPKNVPIENAKMPRDIKQPASNREPVAAVPATIPVPSVSVPPAGLVGPSDQTLDNIPLPVSSPSKSKAGSVKQENKQPKKPPKKKKAKVAEAQEEKTAAPVKFKINAVEITEPPTPSEKIQQAAKRKIPIKVEKKPEEKREKDDSVSPRSKSRKEDGAERNSGGKPKILKDSVDKSSEKSDRDSDKSSRSYSSRSRHSLSPERREAKHSDRSDRRESKERERHDSRDSEGNRSGDDRKERHASKETDFHISGTRVRRDDHYRSQRPAFRGRGSRGRGRQYRWYASDHGSRSRSRSPSKIERKEKKDDVVKGGSDVSLPASMPTPSTSQSDTMESVKEASSDAALGDKDLQDVDERTALKRPVAGSVEDQLEESASVPKKAKLSTSEESVDVVSAELSAGEGSAMETDSKEDLGNIFSGEDVDYRQQTLPNSNSPRVQQSPAQQRWSKFKESHPDEFLLERERRKSLGAADEVRRTSVAAAGVSGPRHEHFDRSLQDVDFRRRAPPRQSLLPHPVGEGKEDIPSALVLERQEEIIMQAEQEVAEGRMSHGEHQALLLQLGQVYDRQRRQRQDSDSELSPRFRRDRMRHRLLKSDEGMDSDFRMAGTDHRYPESREMRHGDVDVDFRRHERREDSGHFGSPRADFDSRGSPRADFDVRGSPKSDFDARRNQCSDYDARDGPRHGPGRNFPRAERDYDEREGSLPPLSDSGKRPLLGFAPGVPVDGSNREEHGSHADFDPHDNWNRPDYRGPDAEYDRGMSAFESGRALRDRDRRGHARDFGGPDYERNLHYDGRNYHDRQEEYDPGEEYEPHGPRRGGYPVYPRGRGRGRGVGRGRYEDECPTDEYIPEDYGRRGPYRGRGRGSNRDFDEHRSALEEFDDGKGSREYDMPKGPRDFEGHHEFNARGPRPLMPPPDGRMFSGSRSRADGPRPRFDGPGPRPRMDGPGPRPRMDGPVPRPRMDGPRPRMDVPVRGGRPHGAPPGHQNMGHSRPHGLPFAERVEENLPQIVPGSPMDDPRWSYMRGLLEKEVNEEVVVDGKPYEVKMGHKHMLKLYGRICEVYIDPIERAIRIDGNILYKFGEPKKEVDLGHRRVELFYHGPPLSIWIDGQQHRVRIDAPPLSMTFDNNLFGFQIDGRDNMILIDRLEKGPLGGPSRPLMLNGMTHEIAFEAPKRNILIDSQNCELKLDRKIPLIISNGKPHGIRFDGGPRKMFIDEVPILVPMDAAVKAKIGNRPHLLAFGGPAHEVIIDGKWYEVKFNNVPKNITIGNRIHSIRLEPPVPRVKILAEITQGLDEGDSLLSQAEPMTQPPLPPPALANRITPTKTPGVAPVEVPREMRPEGAQQPRTELRPGPMIQQPQPVREEKAEISGSMPSGPVPTGAIQSGPVPSGLGPSGPMPSGVMPGMQSGQMGGPGPLMGGPVMNQPSINPLLMMLPGLGGLMTMPQMFPNPVPNPMMMSAMPRMISGPGMHGMTHQPGFPSMSPQQLVGAPAIQQPAVPSPMPIPVQQPEVVTTASPAVTAPAPTLTQAITVPSTPAVATPDVNELLKKLLAAGIIGNQAKAETPSAAPDSSSVPEAETPVPISSEDKPLIKPLTRVATKKEVPLERPPDLSDFQLTKLKKQYSWVVHQLYEGIQCTSCGCRFLMEEMEQYRQHLDWHFRLNKKEKEATKMATYRKWYYELNDWILYQEVHETENVQSSVFEEDATETSDASNATYSVKVPEGVEVVYNPTATGVEADDVCVTCRDPFEQYWDEEAEEWHLRNAISVDGKIYHPICYDDVKESSGSELTPTPAVEPLENPLVGQIKQELSFTSISSASLPTPSASSISMNSCPTPLVSEAVQNAPVKMEPEINIKAELSDTADSRTVSVPAALPLKEIKTEPQETTLQTPLSSHVPQITESVSKSQESAGAESPSVVESSSVVESPTNVKTEPVGADVPPSVICGALTLTAPSDSESQPSCAEKSAVLPSSSSHSQSEESAKPITESPSPTICTESIVKEEPMETS